jgi:GT2 family glycosyltransferase/2-polyprenyl-3-methyl-5-hydroxy-6-metoxy-1,4-benzoquinol methylase
MDSALRYDRPPELEGEDSLSEIARLIAPGATVLDLGAATGKLGGYLRARKGCVCDGVELDPKAAAVARPHYRTLLELNLEHAKLADHFPPGVYDAIVCADVLEHLHEPGRILDQLAPLLSPGGRVLLSIPNVGYAGLIAGLLHGEFEYRPTGLLDDTHVRFFTRSSLLRLVGKHGFRPISVTPLQLPIQLSEFRESGADALPPGALRALLSHPDALTYQFIVEAAPGAGIPPSAPAGQALPRFTVQLYWTADGTYRESDSTIGTGVMGEEHQQIELRIPPLPRAPSSLRFDVADRPGFVRLHAVSLHDAIGKVVWSWDGKLASLERPREMRVLAGAFAGTLLCTGADPSVELPIPSDSLARLAAGGVLRVETSWPFSGDYALANKLIDERERAWEAERGALLQSLENVRREVSGKMRRAEALERLVGSLEAKYVGTTHQIERLALRLETLDKSPRLWRLLRQSRKELFPARFDFELVPGPRLESRGGGTWEARDSDPHFVLRPRGDHLPGGWVLLDIHLELEKPGRLQPHLYLDRGLGFSERDVVRLPRPEEGRISVEVWLPRDLTSLRFDPTDREGTFRLSRVRMRELGRIRAAARFAAPLAKNLVLQPGRLPAAASRIWSIFRSDGARGLQKALVERSARTGTGRYDRWIEEYDRLQPEDRAAIVGRIESLKVHPRFSVLMPVYNTPEKWLRRAIESVKGQLYPDWQLCIADDASTRPVTRRLLRDAAASDPRIRVVFREKNGHISAASNDALAMAEGDYVVLLDHDDEFAPHALYMMAEEIAAHPDLDLAYSDEDKIDAFGDRYDPHFKPDWNPDLLSSQNYVSHLTCYRTSLVRRVGGFREGYDGSQDYDLLLRASAHVSPDRIRHVPHVLYHWRSADGSTAANADNKRYAIEAALKALRERYPRADVSEGPFPTTYRVRYPLSAHPPLTTLIIPTRDGRALLEQAISSIRDKTQYPRYEIVIVDNQSTDPATLEYLKSLETVGQARILRYEAPFNYSAINNFAVRQAAGEIVCLLNNDVEVIEPEWLTELVSHAVRDEIGAVGCKLLYPDGTIQHAGVIAGLFGVAGHVFKQFAGEASGYFGRAQLLQNLSICTAACLAIRKSTYLKVGGLDEENLHIAFNDVDFCLRVMRAGFRNLYTPHAVLYHHESATRGYEDTPEKQERFQREVEFMKARWGSALETDPAYNPNLSLESLQMELAWPPRAVKPWKAT